MGTLGFNIAPENRFPRRPGPYSRYFIPQTDTNTYVVGSAVMSAGGADSSGTIAVMPASGTGAVRGVVLAVDPASPATGMAGLEKLSVPAVKTRDYYVWVNDDPAAMYTLQDDGLTPANATAGNVNRFANFSNGVTLGQSSGGSASASAPSRVLVASRVGTPSIVVQNGAFAGWDGASPNQPGVSGVNDVPISTPGSAMTDGIYPLVFAGGGAKADASGTYTIAGGVCTAVSYLPGKGYLTAPTCVAGGTPGGTKPTFVNVAIGRSAREFNTHLLITITDACSVLKLGFGNVMPNSSSPILTEPAPMNLQLRVGVLLKGSNNPIQGTWPNGTKDITLGAGETSEASFVGSFAVGDQVYVQERGIYDYPPAFWPTSSGQFAIDGAEDTEFGTALLDRTMAADPYFGPHATVYAVLPPLYVTGMVSGAPKPRVAVLADSIGSTGNLDTTFGPFIGFLQRALAAAGVPFVNIGASGSGVVSFMNQSAAARNLKYAAIRGIGITHCVTNWVTNDLSGTTTDNSAVILSALQALKAEMLTMGIKLIAMTCPPRTSSANTGTAPGDTANTLVGRRNFNIGLPASSIPYFDLAAYTQEPTNIDRWRLDLNPGTVDPVHPNSPTHDAATVAFGAALPTLLAMPAAAGGSSVSVASVSKSSAALLSSSIGDTGSVRLRGLAPIAGNTFGPGAIWLVSFAKSELCC